MRFTPVLFASAVAAAGYYPAPVSSSSVYDPHAGYGAPKPTSSSSSAAGYGGYWPKVSSSSSSSVSKKGPKKWKTTTSYETECYTVTSSSSTKVWTSVKAIPTVCEDDDDEDSWAPKTSAKSTPYSPVKPSGSSIPYCAAVTETCTVTVTATATGGADYTPKPKPTASVAYSAGADSDSWPKAYPKPSGTGSYTKPVAPQFTGAASAQKAGAFLAGAGAVAAMLL